MSQKNFDDYDDILTNHNFPMINRPATIKTTFLREVCEITGFCNSLHKN